MKKWAIPLAAAALIAVIAVAGAAFAPSDSGGDGGSSVSRGTAEGGEPTGDDAAAICLQGAIDCDDTIEKPVDDVCPDIYPPPPGCGDPDEPVSNEPPIIDDPVQNDCIVAGNSSADWYSAECEKVTVALAIEDLSLRLGSPQGITVQSVEFVQWPDSCLGISKTDVACAEVITPGYRIVLEAGDRTYEYHTASASWAVLVE